MILILIFIVVIALCVAGMAVSILVRKNGKFPETSIAKNKDMRKLGITCIKHEELNRLKDKTKCSCNADINCNNCMHRPINT